MANSSLYQYGNARPKVNEKYVITIKEGLQGLGDQVTYTPGCSTPKCDDYISQNVSDIVRSSDLVIVCLGLGEASLDLCCLS